MEAGGRHGKKRREREGIGRGGGAGRMVDRWRKQGTVVEDVPKAEVGALHILVFSHSTHEETEAEKFRYHVSYDRGTAGSEPRCTPFVTMLSPSNL